MSIRRVSPGQKIRIAASDWNQIAEVVDAERRRQPATAIGSGYSLLAPVIHARITAATKLAGEYGYSYSAEQVVRSGRGYHDWQAIAGGLEWEGSPDLSEPASGPPPLLNELDALPEAPVVAGNGVSLSTMTPTPVPTGKIVRVYAAPSHDGGVEWWFYGMHAGTCGGGV